MTAKRQLLTDCVRLCANHGVGEGIAPLTTKCTLVQIGAIWCILVQFGHLAAQFRKNWPAFRCSVPTVIIRSFPMTSNPPSRQLLVQRSLRDSPGPLPPHVGGGSLRLVPRDPPEPGGVRGSGWLLVFLGAACFGFICYVRRRFGPLPRGFASGSVTFIFLSIGSPLRFC